MADIKPIHHSRQGEKEEKRRKWGGEEKLTHYVQPHTVCKYCAFISLCESDHTEKPGKNADFLWYGTLGMHSSLVMCFFDFPCSSVTMHKPSNILILSISHTGQAAPGAWSYFFSLQGGLPILYCRRCLKSIPLLWHISVWLLLKSAETWWAFCTAIPQRAN